MTAADSAGSPTAAVTRVLIAALVASIVLALWPGPGNLPAALVDLARDVSAHDSETLRREHDGWYARLLDINAAIAVRVPAEEPLVLQLLGVPPWFVAAHAPQRAVYLHDATRLAEWQAQGRHPWLLRVENAEPLRWSLAPADGSGQ